MSRYAPPGRRAPQGRASTAWARRWRPRPDQGSHPAACGPGTPRQRDRSDAALAGVAGRPASDFDPFWGTAPTSDDCLASWNVTSHSPIRGIKGRTGSRKAGSAARRAVEPEPQPATTTQRSRSTSTSTETKALARPLFGKAERQLILGLVATALVVLLVTVVLPLLMSWVRNF